MPETDGSQQASAQSMEGRTCISFEVRGPWAHFRRVEGNIVKQTYRIPPRTTVAGLTAAIIGADRDAYYEAFGPGRSAVAVEPLDPLRTFNMPMNSLATSDSDPSMISLNPRGKISVKLPPPHKPRKQHNYEVLVEPRYRIDLWTEDDFQDRLREQLEAGRSHYVPSLGLSEHLADIEYLGRHTIQPGPRSGQQEVDSAVPGPIEDIVPTAGTRHELERSPGFMETVDRSEGGGRRTTGFLSVGYSPEAAPLTVQDPNANEVDGRTVMFA